MTNKEAFASVIQVTVLDDNTLNLGLIEAGIDPDIDFAQGKLKDLEIAAIPVLESLLVISSTSEGGFSQSINPDSIKQRLLFIAEKYSISEVLKRYSKNKVSDASDLW